MYTCIKVKKKENYWCKIKSVRNVRCLVAPVTFLSAGHAEPITVDDQTKRSAPSAGTTTFHDLYPIVFYLYSKNARFNA